MGRMSMLSVLATFAGLYTFLSVLPTSAFTDIDNVQAPCDDLIGRGCGNGQCVSGSCVCNAFWSTKTDFVELEDCDGNSFIGVWILWALNVAALLWSYYASLGVILVRFEVFFETKKARRGYGIRQNKGLMAIIAYFAISTPAHMCLAILQFVNPETRIGFDVFPTLCFFFAKLGLYISIFLLQGTMFATTMKGGDKAQQRLVQINYAFYCIIAVLSICVGAFGFITLGSLQDDVWAQVQVMRAYYLAQGITLLGNGFGAWILMRTVNKALNRVRDIQSGQGRGENIRKKIEDIQSTAMKSGLGQGIVYILMGSIPYFINKHKYFLPLSWLIMPVLGKKLAHQFVADGNAKTVMQRLGIKRTGGSSENQPTSGTGKSGQKSPLPGAITSATSNPGGVPGQGTEMIASSMMESLNPAYNPSIKDYRKKKKTQEQQKSSFMSEGTLLEELLDPGHPLNKRFVQFVESKYAQNEVALLGLALKYKNAQDSKERTKIGKQAVKEFIEDGAPRAVDLPHDVRDILLSTAKRSQWVNGSMDQIRRNLMFDLKGNFLGKFEQQLEVEALKEDV